VVGIAAGRIVLEQIGDVVAAIDGPVISGAEEVSELGAVSGLGRGEAALPGFLFQGLVVVRKVEDRNFAQTEDAVARDHVIFREDRERFAVQGPPGVGDMAIGDDAVVDDVAILEFLGGHALEVERLLRDEQSRSCHDFGFREALNVRKSPVVSHGVVLGRIAVKDLVVQVVAIGDVAVRGKNFRVFVVFGLVGAEGRVGQFDNHHAVKARDAAVGVLRGGGHVVIARRRRIGARKFHAEVGLLHGGFVVAGNGGRRRGRRSWRRRLITV